MLIRISLIVAIIAALGVAAFNFTKVKEKVTILQNNWLTESNQHQLYLKKFTDTDRQLKATNAVLVQTKAMLDTATQERDDAVKKADEQTKLAEKLQKDLDKTTAERQAAQEKLNAYEATGMNPKAILALRDDKAALEKTVAGMQAENKELAQMADGLRTRLQRYEAPDKPVELPASLQGKVVVCDPKWNFVVLDIGADQNVREYGQMLVDRNGKLVAKIIVSSLQKDRSIANVMPGWQIGEIFEGDRVIPAYPAAK
jgi:hypothetical protein